MLPLRPVVQPYAWGRIDGMSDFVGSTPSGGPEAELWVGTHPAAPSVVEGDGRTLAELIAADPVRHLGEDLAARGHTTLPFLLKVLSIGAPLSLQAHPSSAQAAAGFEREERAGIPLDDPRRTYRDPNPKPEALVALVDTWALCGFRSTDVARRLLGNLSLPALDPLRDRLDSSDQRDAFAWLLRLRGSERAQVVEGLAKIVEPDPTAEHDPTDPAGERSTRAWIARIQAAFPGDPSALAPILVDLVRIPAGAAVHLPAGNLHAYLEGAGVEVMAASDNVLRGGLTPKYVDVDELLQIVRFEPGQPPGPDERPIPGGTRYDFGETAFSLTLLHDVDGRRLQPDAPTLLLATNGDVTLRQGDDRIDLRGGRAAFIAPDEGPVTTTGDGRLWCATTGPGSIGP